MAPRPDPRRTRASVLTLLVGAANRCLRAEDLGQASKFLETAQAIQQDDAALQLALGRLCILEGDAAGAMEALEKARDLDPFDEDAADLLGQMHAERGEHLPALECFADARLLDVGADPGRMKDYDARIEQLLKELEIDDAGEREAFFGGRSARYQALAEEAEEGAERIQAERGRLIGEGGAVVRRATVEVLREVGFFGLLSERELELLERAVERWKVTEGKAVFREGQPSEDIYVVGVGKVLIQRQTPFGTQVLATVPQGHLFGEMNFIDGLTRSADAVAAEDVELLRISHASLRDLFQSEKHLAIAFLEQFWRSLSEKVREGNELMKSFFAGDAAQGGAPAPSAAAGAERAGASGTAAAGVSAAAKAGVLHEKGLTGRDLGVIAEFADAVKFDLDQVIFREGDSGRELYIVLEGRVRISKHIPGVGEEALAILERGDFFGEMGIVDNVPRSASALSHEAGTVVLRIDKGAIDAILGRDTESAYEFLFILCRILSGRLREINDKIIQWRMMSGGF
jgi:CRP-like cAMP-binding protein